MTTTDGDAIRELMDASSNAVRTRDVDALMSHFAPDVLSFDIVGPLQYEGLQDARNVPRPGSRRSTARSAIRSAT